MSSKLLSSGLLFAACQSLWAANLSVTPTGDANAMANALLGSGVTINSASYTGATGSAGFFSGGLAAGLGIDTGVLLTSGQSSLAIGPNNQSGATGNNGTGGSSMLNSLIPGYTTYDAAILTLNFSSTGGSVYFNYVFGSEEYNEWVGSSFNDVFGFFLDGTSAAHNWALIPSTTTPVSINNVNNGSNSSYYRDNTFSPYTAPGVQYDGLTKMLTVSISNLSAGDHTIYMGIADAGDHVLDSGVFIQGKSFSDTPGNPDDDNEVPDAGSSFVLSLIALSGLALIRRRF